MTRRHKRPAERRWNWKEGARVRVLKKDGFPDDFARAIAKAEYKRKREIAALLNDKIANAAKLCLSFETDGKEFRNIRFQIAIDDALLRDDDDRKVLAEYLRTNNNSL